MKPETRQTVRAVVGRARAPCAAVPSSDSRGFLLTFEAAQHLRISPRSLQRFVRRGLVGHFRIGGRLLFRVADLDALAAKFWKGPVV
jgi:hypothetical protein